LRRGGGRGGIGGIGGRGQGNSNLHLLTLSPPPSLLLPPALPPSTFLLLLSFCFAHCPRRKRKKRARKVITEQARGRKPGNGRLRVVSSV
jgi:hypothetical protein